MLVQAFRNRRRQWLRGDGASSWPWGIDLGPPAEREALRQPEGVRAWVEAWRAWRGAGTVVWADRRWRSLGTQRLPARLVLQGPEDVASWVGEGERWRRAGGRYREWVARWPALAARLPRYLDVLADYAEADWRRLGDMLAWIVAHPRSNVYPRQLPLAGMDSKWVERHSGILADLVAALRGDPVGGRSGPHGPAGGEDAPHGAGAGERDFHRLCGFKAVPRLVSLRLLDRALRDRVGGLGYLAAPWEELASLDLPAARVFIVENRQTGLAFPDLPGAVVFLGLGYDLAGLAGLPWVRGAETYYWGDLDTHGFAILSRARSYLPALRSLLMDEETLLRHRDLWVVEEHPHPADELPHLDEAEGALYRALKLGRWGARVRLEQERIAWDHALAALRDLT